jgi:hypothetical protein
MVLLGTKYLDTVSQDVPYTTYTPGPTTTVTTLNSADWTASIYGTGGYARGSGDATGLSVSRISGPGTYNTNWFRYSYSRYRYTALFFKRLDTSQMRLGALLVSVQPEQREVLKTNAGCMAMVVYEGTPAFAADIMDGDILLAIDGAPLLGPDHVQEIIAQKDAGAAIRVDVRRNGQTSQKTVTLR